VAFLLVFFPRGLWLARNGAKASEASRSAVERQPKRAPAPGRSRLLIPKWLPKPNAAPIPRSTNNASWSRLRLLLPYLVASALCFAAKVCTRRSLTYWRRERADGIREALTPRKRGPKSKRNPREEEFQKLRRQNARLTEDLRKAHIIIDVQKKVAALLGNPIPETDPDPEEKS
jgi:transposase